MLCMQFEVIHAPLSVTTARVIQQFEVHTTHTKKGSYKWGSQKPVSMRQHVLCVWTIETAHCQLFFNLHIVRGPKWPIFGPKLLILDHPDVTNDKFLTPQLWVWPPPVASEFFRSFALRIRDFIVLGDQNLIFRENHYFPRRGWILLVSNYPGPLCRIKTSNY